METTKTVIYTGSGDFLGMVKVTEKGNLASILPKGAEAIGELFLTELRREISLRLQFGGSMTFKVNGKKFTFLFREAKGIHAKKLTVKQLVS